MVARERQPKKYVDAGGSMSGVDGTHRRGGGACLAPRDAGVGLHQARASRLGLELQLNTSLFAGFSYFVNPARRKVLSPNSRPNRSARA